MRKISLFVIMVLGISTGNAQKSKVTSAATFLASGKLNKAKECIDSGIQDEKCAVWPKAYLVKGKVYQGIFESPLQVFRKLSDNPLEVAYESYLKAMELDVKGKLGKEIKFQVTNLIPDFTNKAIQNYNDGNYNVALTDFEKVLELEGMDFFKDSQVVDTAVIFNAGMAAQKCENYDKAILYFKKSIDYNYDGARAYANLANSLKANNQQEEAVKYLQKGFELYPDNNLMLVELINHYLFGGEPEKAAEYLDKAIEMDPSNGSLYSAKGNLYEKTKEIDKALEMYQKAMDLNPKDHISRYNFALLRWNQVAKHHEEVNAILEAEKYNKEIKAVLKEYKEKVVPCFESVLEIQPKEKNALIALKELYFKLRNEYPSYMEKYEEVKNKLESME